MRNLTQESHRAKMCVGEARFYLLAGGNVIGLEPLSALNLRWPLGNAISSTLTTHLVSSVDIQISNLLLVPKNCLHLLPIPPHTSLIHTQAHTPSDPSVLPPETPPPQETFKTWPLLFISL